jgi:acetyltransferase AlgX (SGNH hydrolase-like protein)
MYMSSRLLLLWVLLGAISLSPIAVGAFDVFLYAPVEVMLLVFAAYALRPTRGRRSKQVLLALISVCFTLTLVDLAARPLLFYLFEVRPSERFIHRWQPLPQLQRYVAGVNFAGATYGDLAAVSGRRDWREWRQIKFLTDEDGFRNEPPGKGFEARPLDVIVLGDSFGVAAGTSQEEILSSLLVRDFGLSVYNLSISRANPQQEYANLLLEGKRLNTREGTRVLWLIFPGNDLDEPYYPELENPRPVWPGPLKRLANDFSDFRSRSPVHRLLSRGESGLVIERKFVDGRRVLFHETYAQRRIRTVEDVMRHPNFESLKRTLGAMKRLAGERRLTVAVALVPSKEEVYSWVLNGAPPWSADVEPSGFSAVLRGLCEQHDFRFLDMKPSLVEASRRYYEKSGALLWWRDDTHWNGAGQRAAAAALYENLLRGILNDVRAEPAG